MATALKAGWSKPSTILFATEFPANEKAFSFALAQACEFGADLILDRKSTRLNSSHT